MKASEIIAMIGTSIGVITSVVTPTAIHFKKRINAVKLGVQALLRNNLYQEYNRYKDKGYAPIWAKENFENMWQQYHNLGKNGVMDEIHKEFMSLPTEK